MPLPCSVSENTVAFDQATFWDSSASKWDAHKIGWTVAGGCTILVRSFFTNWMSNQFHEQFTDDTDILGYHSTTLQVCPSLKASEMLDLMHIVRLEITQIQLNSDRC